MKRILLSILWVTTTLWMSAQTELPTISREDMESWQSLRYSVLSDDGQWISYVISVVEGDDTLHIKNTSDPAKHYTYPVSSRLAFSDDSEWAAMRIGYSEKKLEKMRDSKKPVHYKARLVHLRSGRERVFEGIESFSFQKDGPHLFLRKYAEPKQEWKGKDLLVMHLETGILRNIGNVADYGVNKKGRWLAYVIDAKDRHGNAVEAMDLNTYSIQVIDSDTAHYKGLQWEEKGRAFAFYKALPDTAFEEDNHYVFACFPGSNEFSTHQLDPREQANIGEEERVKETRRLSFSEDLNTVFFGVHDWTRKDTTEQKKKTDTEDFPDMDIWHWKDDPIQPRQKRTLNSDRNFTVLYAWHLDRDKTVRISDEVFRNAQIVEGGKHVLIGSDKKYQPAFRLRPYDYYLVDAATGDRTFLKEKFTGSIRSSETGRYLLYFDDKNWWTYDIYTGKHTNITEGLEVPFWNVRDDSPKEIKPPFYGYNRWYEDDAAVLLYDEYDIWKVSPDGNLQEKITDGRGEDIIYRYYLVDREEDFITSESPFILTKAGDKTKKSGYAQVTSNGKVKELIYEDRMISGITKAEDTDAYIFSKQTYSESPNLYYADGKFNRAQQLTNTNPQQENFAWGHSELVNYTNRDGKELQGALFYPANYEEGKEYPMIVYIYEILSTQLHRYVTPSPRSSYNTTNYTQQGFFIFQPDIVYKTNHPGESAVDCVVPAVEEVLKTGMIDRERIGIMGHSWGAYQTAFIITQTDLFNAAVAGAPLTNMISMYNSIYWNTGTPDQNIFETSQGRLREPWWVITEEYMQNSPMFQARNIKTPLLVAFGNEDGAVDWHQGIEMYTTMRRMEKPYIMLVYEGENHGLRKEENQLDYTLKINQFFNHHLLGKEAKDWIKEGRTYLKKQKQEKAHNKK